MSLVGIWLFHAFQPNVPFLDIFTFIHIHSFDKYLPNAFGVPDTGAAKENQTQTTATFTN